MTLSKSSSITVKSEKIIKNIKMERIKSLTSQIRIHSKINCTICIIELIISLILIGLTQFHLPILITLEITCTISLISGTIGWKINEKTEKKKILIYFVIQIMLLAVWDFGGVICVIYVIFGIDHDSLAVLITVCIISGLVYIGVFLYFWYTFKIVNKLLLILNDRNSNQRLSINQSYTQNNESICNSEE